MDKVTEKILEAATQLNAMAAMLLNPEAIKQTMKEAADDLRQLSAQVSDPLVKEAVRQAVEGVDALIERACRETPDSGSLRDYGFGDSTRYVKGRPRVKEAVDGAACPSCGCEKMFLIVVDVEHPNLRGNRGTGSYVACPACSYASPMLMTAGGLVTPEKQEKGDAGLST